MKQAVERLELRGVIVLSVAAWGLSACVEGEGLELGFEQVQQPIDAICTAPVRIRNADPARQIEVEGDYLAHVVRCENGNADTEALKAQAVAARSYLYYKLGVANSIGDGQNDQVYSCSAEPDQRHYDAVAATSGMILRYNNTQVAAFYVAGAIPTTDTCYPAGGDRDPTNTERYVTYNEGRSGSNLTQTTLGWVNPQNWANRGCKSQNGANCLSQHGRTWQEIVHFYYGEDIEIVQAEGACVSDPGPQPERCQTTVASMGDTVIDDANGCFDRSCANGPAWWDHNAGIDGHSFTTYTIDGANRDCYGRWNLRFAQAGDYTVWVNLVEPVPVSQQATYRIHHNGAVSEVTVSQRGVNGWLELGSFTFAADGDQYVQLDDNTGEAYTDSNGIRVLYDAVRVAPTPPDDPGNNDPGNNDPANNDPGNNDPANNTPGNNDPANNDPGNNDPGNNDPGNNAAANNTPGNNDPNNSSAGNNSAPGNNNPGNNDPGNNDPGNNAAANPDEQPTNRVNAYEESCAVAGAPGSTTRTLPVGLALGVLGVLGLAIRRRR